MNEKEVLCNCIENYIEIANINKNTLSDYFCIISFIKILQEQYPKYKMDFEVYINLFKEKGILEAYNKKDIVFQTYIKYGINPRIANEIKLDYSDNQYSSRYIKFMTAIAICGTPSSLYSKYILFEIYSWNYSAFANQTIYYGLLYLKELEKNNSDERTLELTYSNIGKAYMNLKNYDEAIHYFKIASKYSYYSYKNVISAYKKKKDVV